MRPRFELVHHAPYNLPVDPPSLFRIGNQERTIAYSIDHPRDATARGIDGCEGTPREEPTPPSLGHRAAVLDIVVHFGIRERANLIGSTNTLAQLPQTRGP